MNIQETVIEQICKQFEIDPNNYNQQFSVDELKDIIRCTTNTMLMAHFQILLENYLEHTDTNNAFHKLSVLANLGSENEGNAIKNISDFSEIGKKIALIEVSFLEASLGLKN